VSGAASEKISEPNGPVKIQIGVGVTRPGTIGPDKLGSDEVFARLYAGEYDHVVRLAWLLTRSDSIAEDIAQEAFTAVYRSLGQIRDPKRYLGRTVVNRAKTRQRDEVRNRARLERIARDSWLAAEAGDVILLDAVGRLPYRQRAVIVCRYWGDWTEADIAAALGCRPGTVKSLAARAMAQLRREVMTE
jgi:RNA polymerase sigma factor (sigma-70 family)